MSLAPVHSAAVSGSHYTTTEAVQIKLPGNITLNLIRGSGVIRFIVGTTLTTFTGSDPEFGSIGAIGEVGFSMEASSPVWKMSILPNSPAAISVLCSPQAQGSIVQYWTVVVNPATGAVINAHRLWRGKIDTQTVTTGSATRVDIDVVTPTDLLMAQNEGERLTVAWQQLHFPGQRGLEFNVDAMEQPFWGNDAIRSNPTSSTPGAGGGVFTGGGGAFDIIHGLIRSRQ